jgi:hypothetical protein
MWDLKISIAWHSDVLAVLEVSDFNTFFNK